MRIVRGAKLEDADEIWRILEPMVRAGETYTLPREMSKDEALAYWMGADHEVFVAEEDGEILGTYPSLTLQAILPNGPQVPFEEAWCCCRQFEKVHLIRRSRTATFAKRDSDVTLGRIGSRIGLPWLLK